MTKWRCDIVQRCTHQLSQSRGSCSKEETSPWNPGSLSSSVMLSQVSSGSHGTGLSGWFSRSSTIPPRSRNAYSPGMILPCASNILTHMWKEKSSLCCSNRPRHVFLFAKIKSVRSVCFSLRLHIFLLCVYQNIRKVEGLEWRHITLDVCARARVSTFSNETLIYDTV